MNLNIPEARNQKPEARKGACWIFLASGFWLLAFLPLACAKPTPLTAEKAEQLITSQVFKVEPVYAEVPQKVSFGPRSPKDDYDEKAVRTLQNLEKAGLVDLAETREPDGTTTYLATVTKAGFSILGTIPSARGPTFRARIAEKRLERVQNFVRHPNEPTVGRAEMVWLYVNPTKYYEMFETKIDKPINQPFVSLVSFYWDKGWKFNVTVRKTAPQA